MDPWAANEPPPQSYFGGKRASPLEVAGVHSKRRRQYKTEVVPPARTRNGSRSVTKTRRGPVPTEAGATRSAQCQPTLPAAAHLAPARPVPPRVVGRRCRTRAANQENCFHSNRRHISLPNHRLGPSSRQPSLTQRVTSRSDEERNLNSVVPNSRVAGVVRPHIYPHLFRHIALTSRIPSSSD